MVFFSFIRLRLFIVLTCLSDASRPTPLAASTPPLGPRPSASACQRRVALPTPRPPAKPQRSPGGPALHKIALRATLCISTRMFRRIRRQFLLSRRRRTFVLCQHSTQQAQTRMSRYANVGAFALRKTTVRTRYAPIRTALAWRNHPESSSAPIKTGTELAEAIRSDPLCRDAQPNREPAWASLREMVLAAPPRPSPSASAQRGFFTRNPNF